MSRKRNSPDNGMMESFFGILKSEMFYGYENNYKSLEDLEQAITNDIDYYNDLFWSQFKQIVVSVTLISHAFSPSLINC